MNGYKYIKNDIDENNTYDTMYEFYVDSNFCLDTMVKDVPHGGYLSVRKNQCTKPLIIFGQDESIYKQFQLNKKR